MKNNQPLQFSFIPKGVMITNPEALVKVDRFIDGLLETDRESQVESQNSFPELMAIWEAEMAKQLNEGNVSVKSPAYATQLKKVQRSIVRYSVTAVSMMVFFSMLLYFASTMQISNQDTNDLASANMNVDGRASTQIQFFPIEKVQEEVTALIIKMDEPVTQPKKQEVSIPTFVMHFQDGFAKIKWSASETEPATYVLEKSLDGENFDIVNIFDSKPSKKENSYFYSARKEANFYRLVKIVHGEEVFKSQVFSDIPASDIANSGIDNSELVAGI